MKKLVKTESRPGSQRIFKDFRELKLFLSLYTDSYRGKQTIFFMGKCGPGFLHDPAFQDHKPL